VPDIEDAGDDLQSLKVFVKTVIPASAFLERWKLESAAFNVADE